MRPECKVAIVMGAGSDPDAARHARHSRILVPLDSPGVHLERSTTVYGYDDGRRQAGTRLIGHELEAEAREQLLSRRAAAS